MKATIVGGGVIGGGWAARFLLHGWDVVVSDPNPRVATQIAEILANAEKCLPALADVPMPPRGSLSFASSLAEAVRDADWIQESVPEDLAIKHKVIAEIQANAPAHAILGSSTSGFKPSQLQDGASRPGQILVAHPFNPVYLLPLAEVVGGPGCDDTVRDRACELLRSIGMEPLVVRHEIDAHIADRFLEAVWREALWLIKDDIATTEEIDNAIRYGFGLRWGQMGLFETYRLAGGEEGMAHFIRQFGPCLSWPWTKLMDVPELDEELVNKIANQSDAQSGAYGIRELEAIRDRNLVGMLRSLKERDWGAGRVLNANDQRLAKMISAAALEATEVPTRLLESSVLPAWIDYNGHMTEFRYVQVFSDSSEVLFRRVGLHDDYVAAGHSYYTAETHNQFYDEVGVNETYYTTVQILLADAKKLHVFYRMHAAADDRLLATLEAMYLHVHMASGKVVAGDDKAMQKLMALAATHAGLPKPETAGRFVGQR
jgi:carnitine 3-dehydrogenase